MIKLQFTGKIQKLNFSKNPIKNDLKRKKIRGLTAKKAYKIKKLKMLNFREGK